MPEVTSIRLVRQQHPDCCGIATVAMIVGVSYEEAYERLAPPPSTLESFEAYHQRETAYLTEKGWWPSAQILLKTVVSLEELDSIIDSDANIKTTVENSQRVRIVLAFADGAKPDHTVVWDRDHKDVVFDPSRGVVPMSELFKDVGLQTYSGTLGLTSFSYQPGQPIKTWVKTEEGFVPPAASHSPHS